MNVDVTLFEPDCTIWIGVARNIDPTYNHVYAIENNEVESFLTQYTETPSKHGRFLKFEHCLPVRDERDGYVRLPLGLGGMPATYLIWKNITDDGGKPVTVYYAFIEDIKFVNKNCIAVKATLDIFRTFLPAVIFKPCIMERSHWYQGADEKAGDNVYTEPVSACTYYEKAEIAIDELKNSCVVLYKLPNGIDITLRPFGKFFTQFIATKFSSPFDVSQIASYMQASSGRVQSFVVVPDFMVLEGSGYPQKITKKFSYPTTIGLSYVPRNKKLLTYPYIFHEVTAPNGRKKQFHLELAVNPNNNSAHEITYTLTGLSTAQENKLWFYPNYYEGYSVGTGEYPNLEVNETAFIFSEFPELPVSSSAWEGAINNSSLVGVLGGAISSIISGGAIGGATALSNINSAVQSGGELLSANVSGMSGYALMGVANAMASAAVSLGDLATTPSSASGGSTGLADFMTANAPFTLTLNHITEDYAKTLDDFFDLYGYRDPNLRVVDPKLRPHWSFWKSAGICAFSFGNNVGGVSTNGVPAYALVEINKKMMDGVTFWNTDDDLGDYKDFESNHA